MTGGCARNDREDALGMTVRGCSGCLNATSPSSFYRSCSRVSLCVRRRKNVVQARSFSEMLEQTLPHPAPHPRPPRFCGITRATGNRATSPLRRSLPTDVVALEPPPPRYPSPRHPRLPPPSSPLPSSRLPYPHRHSEPPPPPVIPTTAPSMSFQGPPPHCHSEPQ